MTVRTLCLALLALSASSCSEGPCEDLRCYQPNPCDEDRSCGWLGLPYETLVAPTPPRTGELIRLGEDVPWRGYALRTEPGRIYTFSCTAEGFESCDVYLRNGNETEGFVEQEGSTTHVHFRSTRPDSHFAYVSARPVGSTGTFRYAFSERPDDHAPDAANATRLTPGGPAVPGLLQAGPDTDTFAFDMQAGHAFSAHCTGAANLERGITARLTGPDEDSLAKLSIGVSGDGWTGRALATRTGRYVFQLVSDRTTSLAYACSLEDLGVDDHGDAWATATPLPEGDSVPLTGAIQLGYDLDAFTFLARAGHAYALRCDTPTFSPCRDARILDARGNELPAPVGVASDTRLRVKVEGQGTPGVYALTLLDLGADQGAGPRDAVRVTADVPLTGYLTPAGDEDFFRFEAQAGHVYTVQVDGASVEALLLASPSQSLTRYDIAKVQRFLVDADATVLLRVSGPRAKYLLRVQDVGVDDHAGTPEEATDVGDALRVSGVLDASTDVDGFSLVLEARPHAPRITSRDTKFLLFEADGVTPVPWDTARGAWVPRAAGRHFVRADVFGTFSAPDAYVLELLPL
ncbi:hypothetical protein [Corallococcus sp. Z5C101001]|uniref:hypothetical protein n=1 Tax=Corallococcus sp. Z5C101001 TaxID=2596829 RepID=UPI00117C86EC|nr:hypothetical protein [Corallococcus sp. Z5C101001]TSC24104.1 hypothetical protein FOF48_28350 [Corallococcus sp. Z5C101001]